MNHHELALGCQASGCDASVLTNGKLSYPSSPGSLTTGTTASSRNTLPSTPGCDTSSASYFFLQKVDEALKQNIKLPQVKPEVKEANIAHESVNPYAEWKCAFGYKGFLDEPAAIPTSKTEFITVVKGEINVIGDIQDGLRSYVEELHSGKYHDFNKNFLHNENKAVCTTIAQLDQIATNLRAIVDEAGVSVLTEPLTVASPAEEVKVKHREAFAYAQPWVIRARANLVSAHVFYKINYVLGSNKLTAVTN